jgi:hypothetical protein
MTHAYPEINFDRLDVAGHGWMLRCSPDDPVW